MTAFVQCGYSHWRWGDYLAGCCGLFAPGGWRDPEVAFEGTVESRLGLVAHLLGDPHQRCIAVAQLVGSELYSPARQVAHRRLADQAREALRQRRTRQTNLTPKIIDGPLLGHAPVQESQSPRHEAV